MNQKPPKTAPHSTIPNMPNPTLLTPTCFIGTAADDPVSLAALPVLVPVFVEDPVAFVPVTLAVAVAVKLPEQKGSSTAPLD